MLLTSVGFSVVFLLTLSLNRVSDWIDISLTCTPATVQLLFSLLSSSSTINSSIPPTPVSIRLATVLALQRMVAKGLKEPSDKLELLRVLDLGKVIIVLEERTRQARARGPDDDEEAFRESLAKLLTALGLEVQELTKDVRASCLVYV